MESIRRIASVVPPMLLLVLVLAPSIAAEGPDEVQSGCREENGSLLLPTGTATAPPFLTQTGTQGSYAWFVSGIGPYQGEPFLLIPGPGTSTSEINGNIFPDFHIQWLTKNGQFWSQVRVDNTDGLEAGNVPSATAALVWMEYGPDTGTADQDLGATFVLYLGTC